MNVLIFETSLSGHRGSYVRLLLEGLLSIGVNPSIAIPESELQTEEFHHNLADLRADFQLLTMQSRWPKRAFLRGRVEVGVLREAVAKVGAQHVYVPYGATLCRAASLNRRPFGAGMPPVETLLMRSCSGQGRSGGRAWIRAKALDLCVRACPWERIHVLDPLSFKAFSAIGVEGIRLMPEAIEHRMRRSSAEARRRLGLPIEARLVSCPGAISERKGADLLLRAFEASECASTCLVLAGLATPSIRKLIAERYSSLMSSGKLIFRDQYLSNSELDDLFDASDVVAVPYPKHVGSASILLRAAAAEVPVIASDYAWLGWATDTFGLGATVDPSNVEQFSEILKATGHHGQVSEKTEVRKLFLEYHRPSNQVAHWLQLIGQLHSLRTPDCVPFSSVELGVRQPSRKEIVAA